MPITATPPSFSILVVKSDHGANLNPTVLFELAPLVKYPREIFDDNKGKIPWFGHDGTLVSIRGNLKARGLRPPMKVKSFSDIDIQHNGKNFHCKISRKSINIVGGVSLQVSERVCMLLYSWFEHIEAVWSNFRKLKPEIIRDTMSWFLGYAKDMVTDKIDWNKFPDNCDKDLAEMLSLLIDTQYDDIDQRIADIYACVFTPLYERPPKFNGLTICNSVYDYLLPEKVSLAEKSNILYDKGYAVSFHNWAFVKQLKASWTTPEGRVFNFSIQTVGTVKQNSGSGEKESIEMYEKLVTDLGFIPYYDGASCATKSSSPTSEVPDKSYQTLEILERAFKLKAKN
jgi:hypothetical protein